MFEEEEVIGEPSFELRVVDGEPRVSGCYFMHPPIEVTEADWDPGVPGRLLVTASDGSSWQVEGVPLSGAVNVILRPRP